MKIYTRKGDSGDTSLFGGQRVRKDDLRVQAYGSVDELNSALGVVVASLPQELEDWRGALLAIQSELFTLGANLASLETGAAKPKHIPDLTESRVTTVESWIDRLEDELRPIKAFILPGGTEAAAALHLARNVCRRAERRVVALARCAEVEPVILKYLNRLSDFLFTLARATNARQGVPDSEWYPEPER